MGETLSGCWEGSRQHTKCDIVVTFTLSRIRERFAVQSSFERVFAVLSSNEKRSRAGLIKIKNHYSVTVAFSDGFNPVSPNSRLISVRT